MAKRLARKVVRLKKCAAQFRFTSTLEYIDINCKGSWRPELLRVIWLRSHRRVQSQKVEWIATDDQGPNGAEGRAVFDPPIAISLIVTLYRHSGFESKDYKYFIENDGSGGTKILASFTANLAEYAGSPTSRHTLDMNLEPLSKKISQAILGITIESELIKQGNPEDDDMLSTFSTVSIGGESLQFDEEDDENELDEAVSMNIGSVSPIHESSSRKAGSLPSIHRKVSLNPFDGLTNPFDEQTSPTRISPSSMRSAHSRGISHQTSVASNTAEIYLTSNKGKHHNREAELLQKMKEKDQIIATLRMENESLKETIHLLKRKLQTQEEHSRQQEEQRQLKEHELKGWLYKTGVKGPTASVWRRRYFRLDQGDKMHYYKSEADHISKGFIDLLKVVNVSEVSPAQQDKNNSTFHVQCEGRTYQLQAVNVPEMRKWMTAITYLKEFYTYQRTQ